jgi:pentatricopeptide repeat domain-containing protein 1
MYSFARSVGSGPFVRWQSTLVKPPLQAIEYSKLLVGFRETNKPQEALRLLKEIPRAVRDAGHFNTTIGALGKDPKNWKQTLAIMNTMLIDDEWPQPDQVTYSTTILACGRAGQWAKAIQLLNQMIEQRSGERPELILRAYNATISACAKAGQWREALNLLQTMEQQGPKPGIVTINSVISACARGGEVGTALGLLSSMNGGSGTAASDGVSDSESRLLEQAASRFEGVSADVVSFNTAMGGCVRSGQWKEASQLLEVMEAADSAINPDLISYNTAINACAKAGKWEEVHGMLLTLAH